MFFNIIQDLARSGTTIMLTTHFMDEAERCHKIAFISAGRLLAMDTPDNLKHKVIKDILVELEIPTAIDRIDSIEKLPFVEECSLHGALLHVLLKSKEGVAELENCTGAKPKLILPSLEDVFLALTKRTEAGDTGE